MTSGIKAIIVKSVRFGGAAGTKVHVLPSTEVTVATPRVRAGAR
jgi:hypothetical protein